MYFITNEGAAYWYEIKGGGEPIVFLHGFTGTADTWSSVVNEWTMKFKVITVDLPGHGKTETNTPRTMELFCEDLTNLFDHLDLGYVHLAGYSMGGRSALSFAMLYPELVMSLLLESASPGLEDVKEREERKRNDEKLAQRIERNGLESFVDFWEDIPLFQTQKRLPTAIQEKIRNERLSQSEAGLSQSLCFMGTGSQPSWWSRLSQLSKPVCLVAGAHDSKFLQLNKCMKDCIPSSDLVIVENAGHAIHVEQPKIFGKIVTEFINSTL